MLATDITANGCLNDWVYGVNSNGTFTKNTSMTTLPSGPNGIPEGWTVVDFNSPVTTYNVGNKVKIDGHEGIVVELNGKKVVVATMNVGAAAVNGPGCLGNRLAYAETYTGWSGWRLPTLEEMETLCSPWFSGVCGNTEGGEDKNKEPDSSGSLMMWGLDGNEEIDLYLPLNDYYFDGEYSFPFDKYWTGTPGNDDTQYYFAPEIDWEGDGENTYFPIGYDYRVYKEAVAKTDTNNKFLVRLFHNLP